MSCTMLALGIRPAPEGATDAIVDAGATLRAVIELALKSNELVLCDGLIVSMGPKLSVLLGYIDEANLDRVLALADAIQNVLEKRSDNRLFIAGAITRGPARAVKVFGQDWNFEGRPGIAAARILAKLNPGELVLEQEAWPLSELSRLGEPYEIKGKHEAENFRVRKHLQISFPTAVAAPPARSNASKIKGSAAAPQVEYVWEQLDIEAYQVGEQRATLIHERHQLRIVGQSGRIKLPLTLCSPRGDTTATFPTIIGKPQLFDVNGPLPAVGIALPATREECFLIQVPTDSTRKRLVFETFYLPEPLNGRVSIRLPMRRTDSIKTARIVLWGSRELLSTRVAAFSIGIGEPDRGRHPIIAISSEIEMAPGSAQYARVWHVSDFKSGYEYEISWPV